jgi:hypothetical protein
MQRASAGAARLETVNYSVTGIAMRGRTRRVRAALMAVYGGVRRGARGDEGRFDDRGNLRFVRR